MRIGYAKIARSLGLDYDKHGFQGDAEAPNLLKSLAKLRPEITWVVVGRNTGGTLGLPNVENPWDGVGKKDKDGEARIEKMIGELDGIVMHLGQHCSSHFPIPPANLTWKQVESGMGELTSPYEMCKTYGGFLTRGMNALGDRTDGKAPVVYLCADPRNFLKNRGFKWPTGADKILAQYAYQHSNKFERYRDPRTPKELGFDSFCWTERDGELWVGKTTYEHADLELMMLPEDWLQTWGEPTFHQRQPIGIATTSFAVDLGGKTANIPRRSQYVRDWLVNKWPHCTVFGKWDAKSLEDVPGGTVVQNDPTEFRSLLEGWRVTVALPALGCGWTVAKPYQCFAAMTACFLIQGVDDHGWMLPTRRWVDVRNIRDESTGKIKQVAEGLWSVREDWTPDELRLAHLLRVEKPEELHERAEVLMNDQDEWDWVVQTQRQLLMRRWAAKALESRIFTQLGV